MIKVDHLFPKRIWQQIFLIAIVLVAVPMGILGISLLETAYATTERIIRRDLQQICGHAMGEVIKEFEGSWKALDTTASILGALHVDAWRQETALVQLALKTPALRNICALKLDGTPVACSSADAPRKLDARDARWADCLRSRQYCVSDVRFSSAYLPVLDMAVPVYAFGRMAGVLRTEYDLRGIWETIDRIQFGPGSIAVLVDREGRILVHPDKSEILKNDRFFSAEIVHDLERGSSRTRLLNDDKGHRWIAAYAPLGVLPWGLVLLQPYEEAFVLAKMMESRSIQLILICLVLAAIAGFFMSRRVSAILDEIVQAARKVAKGNLSVSLPITRRDDINRMKHAFNHMTLRLRHAQELERLSLVGRSAASIAHELKNSLVLVKSFVQLIPQRHHDRAFVKEAAETVMGELENWNAMLGNIRDFSRDQGDLQLRLMDVNALIDELSLLMKFRAQERGVHLQIAMEVELPRVSGDRVKLGRVLVNLMANAFEATPPAGEIRISSRRAEQGGKIYAVIEVYNSGAGIAVSDAARIFQPFFTTKAHGLGLGLAIAREIVVRHEGTIEVRNEEGKGVAFRVFLPVVEQDPTREEAHDFRENRYRG